MRNGILKISKYIAFEFLEEKFFTDGRGYDFFDFIVNSTADSTIYYYICTEYSE